MISITPQCPAHPPPPPPLCCGCRQPIWDPHLLCIDHNLWHENCVTCSVCQCLLRDKCLVRNQKLFCRNDYINQFGIRCKGCNQPIRSDDPVLRLYTYKTTQSMSTQNELLEKQASLEFQSTTTIPTTTSEVYQTNDDSDSTMMMMMTTKDSYNLSVVIHYFHVYCFKCCDCNRLLTSGEEYTVRDCMPLCIMDYEKQLLDEESQLMCTKLHESYIQKSVQFEENKNNVNAITHSNSNSNTNDHNFMNRRYINDKIREQYRQNYNSESMDKDIISSKEHNRLATSIEMKSDMMKQDISDTVSNNNSNANPGDTSLLSDSVLLSDINISAPNSSEDSSKDADRMDDDDELYEMDSDSESGKNSKRPRTILTANQRRRFKAVFEFNPKPTRKIREALATETGLNIRVVQVWFQNQRAKIKKLARRHAQESRNQMNRRMLSTNEQINMIRSPNSMLFDLRNPSMSDMPYMFNPMGSNSCQETAPLHMNSIPGNNSNESCIKNRMTSSSSSSAAASLTTSSFPMIPQTSHLEDKYLNNPQCNPTLHRAIGEQPSLILPTTHTLLSYANSKQQNSYLLEEKFTPNTSSSHLNNNNISNSSTTSSCSSIFDASIDKLYSMQQTYFM
uniref:LIM zinc-binding domain-containing protein n=1 Tax=Trichobilharzia regenti TaxID=157069 RepID=A0AA85JTR3_TRIRE|nr:unnamed protein product [Trichobilharzia regenti]